MNELQALVTGMLIGALMGQDAVAIEIEPQYDAEGNYLPEFLVEGKESGTMLRITVEVE